MNTSTETSTPLFLVDNGACLCERHLGYTAAATGRDISGQPIHRITPADVEALGYAPECETCRRLSRIDHGEAAR